MKTDGSDRSRLRTELVAGVTTFLTMSYIVVVNPQILAAGGKTGLPFAAVMTATVVVSALASVLMGWVARLPYALAPGMGLNAFVTYTLILGNGMSPSQALGAVVVAGAIFMLLSLTAARTAIARAMPASLRHGAAVGIGLFLTLIGLKNAGVVVGDPVTLLTFGRPSVEVGLFCLGLVTMTILSHRGVRGSILLGIVAVTATALLAGLVSPPAELIATPDFSLFGTFDLTSIWQVSLVGPILTLLFTDLFDSLSTFLGIAQAAGLVDEDGQPQRLERALFVDAVASLCSGLAGTSSATTYVESAAGIREGGRTGLTAIVAGLCFLPLLFFAPLAAVVPGYATAPALVLVGFYMLGPVTKIPTDDLLEAIPAFLTLVLIPLTFSITEGIVWGILAHLLFEVLRGRARAIPAALWPVGACCLLVLAL